MSNFSNLFPLGQKNLFGSGQKVKKWPLIYCMSKVSSGQGQGPSIDLNKTKQIEAQPAPAPLKAQLGLLVGGECF